MIVSTRRIWRSNLFTFPSGFSREALHIVALRRQNRAHGCVFRIWSSSNKACITRSCFVPLQQNCFFCEVSFRTCSLTLNTRKGHSGQPSGTVQPSLIPLFLAAWSNASKVSPTRTTASKSGSSTAMPARPRHQIHCQTLAFACLLAKNRTLRATRDAKRETMYVYAMCSPYVPRFWPAWNFGSPYDLPPARRLFAREQHCAINKHESQWWRSNST